MVSRKKVKIKPGRQYAECRRCGRPVPVFDTIAEWEHYGYVKGAGQLCPICYENLCHKYRRLVGIEKPTRRRRCTTGHPTEDAITRTV